jgi:hypothetical protein
VCGATTTTASTVCVRSSFAACLACLLALGGQLRALGDEHQTRSELVSWQFIDTTTTATTTNNNIGIIVNSR